MRKDESNLKKGDSSDKNLTDYFREASLFFYSNGQDN